MPFIKSEEGKLDFVNQIMNTTQASLNGYFPTSLQNVVSYAAKCSEAQLLPSTADYFGQKKG